MEHLQAPLHNPRCFSEHLGPWIIEPTFMVNAVNLIKDGIVPALAHEDVVDGEREIRTDVGGIAIIHFSGPMMKGKSKFGGVSTVQARNEIRKATHDDDISGILLSIDSPGGTVSGQEDLSTDVRNAGRQKPLFAQFNDLGASAALWLGTQADQVFSNSMADIGSIGVVAVVEDSSGAAEMAGVKVHVISTGKFKGMGIEGSEVTEEQIENIQNRVNEINEFFIDALVEGRNLPRDDVKAMATGEMFSAAKALDLGLIDNIQRMDDTLLQLHQLIESREQDVRKREENARRQDRARSVRNRR